MNITQNYVGKRFLLLVALKPLNAVKKRQLIPQTSHNTCAFKPTSFPCSGDMNVSYGHFRVVTSLFILVCTCGVGMSGRKKGVSE